MAKTRPNTGNKSPNNTHSSQAATANLAADGNFSVPEFFANYRLQSLVIFAIAFVVYIGSLGHQFVQDDAIVITDNMFTQKGAEGIGGILTKDTFFGFFKVEGKAQLVSGGRYRPLTLIIFALVYQLAGPNPFVFHLLTVLLFAATCVLLYHTLRTLIAPKFGTGYAALVAWIATVLFAVHPIHTEVVANVKGCDEIVTLLGSLGALWLTLKAYDTNEAKWGWMGAIVFFLACMSKENAVTYLAVVPLALWVFRGADLGKMFSHTLPLFVGFLVFFIIRGTILHWKFGGAPLELMNNPYIKWTGNGWAHIDFGAKMATIIYTLGKYILLLFVPHPLTHDYYPNHIAIKSFGDPAVLGTLVVYAGLIYYAIKGVKERSILGFGILYFLLTLSIVSNLIFPVGTHMGERFAFMPSVGFCLIAAAFIVGFMRSNNVWDIAKLTMPLAITGLIGAAYAYKTFSRVPAWETNEKLFFTDFTTSFNSAKIRNACGGVLFDKARVETDEAKRKEYSLQAIPHLDKALEIYKDYSDAYVSRGGAHLLAGNYEKSVADYRMAVKLQPEKATFKESLATALREAGKNAGEKRGDLPAALKYLQEAWQYKNTDVETARLLGVAFGVSQNHAEAIKWFSTAVDLEPANASNIFDLGTAYRMSGDMAKAQELYTKAQQLDPQIMSKKGQK
jgi:Flp pilus assembly protein TadD